MLAAACSGDEASFTPCPSVRVLDEPSRLTRFRDGAGRDPVDVVFRAEIAGVGGECSYQTDGTEIEVELNVLIDIRSGPAYRDNGATFSYFVAVAERPASGDASPDVLLRESFPVNAGFPSGRKGVRQSDSLDIRIPRPEGRSVRAYVLYVGIELDAAEMQYNRYELGL